ncbi:MAG: hypothetical protein HY774_29250 [Acidobacteria bacterium]|nr:hypothetical protein [Acidobacteriota bacterium]
MNKQVPAPIRARTILCLDSGGCASKQAAHRLFSSALRAKTDLSATEILTARRALAILR